MWWSSWQPNPTNKVCYKQWEVIGPQRFFNTILLCKFKTDVISSMGHLCLAISLKLEKVIYVLSENACWTWLFYFRSQVTETSTNDIVIKYDNLEVGFLVSMIGYACNGTAGTCSPCNIGSFIDLSTKTCALCPPGQKNDEFNVLYK